MVWYFKLPYQGHAPIRGPFLQKFISSLANQAKKLIQPKVAMMMPIR
jgi:hypothetical protein